MKSGVCFSVPIRTHLYLSVPPLKNMVVGSVSDQSPQAVRFRAGFKRAIAKLKSPRVGCYAPLDFFRLCVYIKKSKTETV